VRIRETPAQKSGLRETPQAKKHEEDLEPPAESERLERKSTGKINRAKIKINAIVLLKEHTHF
jgi:hypothetical protein